MTNPEGYMVEERIIGDLKIAKQSGGNKAHNGFWHKFSCHCIRSTSETILCNPPIETSEIYFQCGYWEKTTYSKVKKEEGHDNERSTN